MTDWSPRLALTAAERQVDFVGHNTHIVEQRAAVEKAAAPAAKRLAAAVVLLGLPSPKTLDDLEAKLAAALDRTALFGYREARREIAALREQTAVTARYVIPDAGQLSRAALDGLPGIRDLLRRRAREAADRIAAAATAANQTVQDQVTAIAVVAAAAVKELHANVLELVGETLNMGRTAGALSLDEPPEYALRSEQLDTSTCEACTREHGEIYQLATDEYFAHLPPEACYGGGRCRGLMVFADAVRNVRLPEAA